MHIHSAAMGMQPIGSYAAGTERAAAAQQAAETRKRLLNSAQSIDDAATTDPNGTLLASQWHASRHSQVLPGGENHTAAEGKDPDFG